MSALFSPSNCIDNFILIGDRQCSTDVSTSGLYLVDLGEIITTDLLANLAGSGSANAVVYAQKIVRRAVLNFQGLVSRAMANLGFTVLQGATPNKSVCKYQNTTSPAAPASRGFIVRRVGQVEKFGAFFVQTIAVKAAQSSPKLLQIIDELGVVLWEKAVDTIANQTVSVQVNSEFDSEILYILLDNTDVDMYKTDCSNSGLGCSPCGSGNSEKTYSISGWDGAQSTTNSFGLVLTGGVHCSFGQVICALLPYFSTSILKLCHVEILNDILHSNRINFNTIYADQSLLLADIEKIKNSANKAINDSMAANLTRLQKSSPKCIVCDKWRNSYMVSIV